MTDLNKWTQKAQEALQNARQLAIRFSQQQLDCEHLLAALLEMLQPHGIIEIVQSGQVALGRGTKILAEKAK